MIDLNLILQALYNLEKFFKLNPPVLFYVILLHREINENHLTFHLILKRSNFRFENRWFIYIAALVILSSLLLKPVVKRSGDSSEAPPYFR